MKPAAAAPRAYYNEHDPFAAAWLRELIKAGHIAPGDVDERSIEDVCPDDLAGYVQCHFFAGIGVWSHALRLAGWPDNRAIWTGSCPCQPFSAAGKGAGFDDERHLWPAFFDLIQQCNPSVVVGEQVASKDGLAWLDLVSADVEGSGRAFAAADLCAAGFGAPHIRQRSFWVAHAEDGHGRRGERGTETGTGADEQRRRGHPSGRIAGRLAYAGRPRSQELGGRRIEPARFTATGATCRLADPARDGWREGGQDSRRIGPGDSSEGRTAGSLSGRSADGVGFAADVGGSEIDASSDAIDEQRPPIGWRAVESAGPGATGGNGSRHSGSGNDRFGIGGNMAPVERPCATNGFWEDADWLGCRDGKWRPVEPGTFPLAHGAANRMGRLRGYGNAIVGPVAQGFIEAVMASETVMEVAA